MLKVKSVNVTKALKIWLKLCSCKKKKMYGGGGQWVWESPTHQGPTAPLLGQTKKQAVYVTYIVIYINGGRSRSVSDWQRHTLYSYVSPLSAASTSNRFTEARRQSNGPSSRIWLKPVWGLSCEVFVVRSPFLCREVPHKTCQRLLGCGTWHVPPAWAPFC